MTSCLQQGLSGRDKACLYFKADDLGVSGRPPSSPMGDEISMLNRVTWTQRALSSTPAPPDTGWVLPTVPGPRTPACVETLPDASHLRLSVEFTWELWQPPDLHLRPIQGEAHALVFF